MTRATNIVIVVSIFLTSMYVGIAGFSYLELQPVLAKAYDGKPQQDSTAIFYNGIPFKNRATLDVYLNARGFERFFSWMNDLPNFGILFITAGSFGVLGGICKVLRKKSSPSSGVTYIHYIEIFTGFFMGIMILGISYIVPALLIQNSTEGLKMTSVMFLCFFAGLFSDGFYKWIEKTVHGWTNSSTEEDK